MLAAATAFSSVANTTHPQKLGQRVLFLAPDPPTHLPHACLQATGWKPPFSPSLHLGNHLNVCPPRPARVYINSSGLLLGKTVVFSRISLHKPDTQCGVPSEKPRGAVWRKRTLPRHSRHHSRSCETARKGRPAPARNRGARRHPLPRRKGSGALRTSLWP